MNAIDIVKEQVKAYEKGIAHAVVTIVHSDGSTPRTNGKMLVYSNGATKGTIGGGNVECIATSDALQCIREGCNRLKPYDMTSEASETGMTCGGNISVMIEVFTVRPVLVMCGAGHIGEAVLRLASFVGFDTILVDNREEKDIAEKIVLADRFVKVHDYEEVSIIAEILMIKNGPTGTHWMGKEK